MRRQRLLAIMRMRLIGLLHTRQRRRIILIVGGRLINEQRCIMAHLRSSITLQGLRQRVLLYIRQMNRLTTMMIILQLNSMNMMTIPRRIVTRVDHNAATRTRTPIISGIIESSNHGQSSIRLQLNTR